jgi:hypothetical protein
MRRTLEFDQIKATGGSMKPRIYIACRFSRKNEAKEIRERLQRLGYIVTSRWLDTEWEEQTEDGTSSAAPPEKREEFAIKDRDDVYDADLILSLTENPKTKSYGRGGRHVEFGMGVALGKRLAIVGQCEHIFHHLPNVRRYDNIQDFIYDLMHTTVFDRIKAAFG